MTYLQAILNGIFIGSLYGLIALGLTIVFGVMKVINFAHGSFLMIGMFASYWSFKLLGLNPYLSLIIVVPLLFFLGYISQNCLIKSVLVAEEDIREPIGVLLLTSGLWLFLDNLFVVLFGPDFRTVPNPFTKINIFITDDILINKTRFTAFILSTLATFSVYFFMKLTETGRAIRCAGQDRTMSGLLGINVFRIYNIAFAIGTCTVGMAGSLLATFYYVQPNVGSVFGIKAFVIVVLGGLGSVWGAFLGGIIIGLIESVMTQFVSSTMTEGIIYMIFLLVLFVRPSGLFGTKQDW